MLHAMLQSDRDGTPMQIAQRLMNILLRTCMKGRHPDDIDAASGYGFPKRIQYGAKVAINGLEFFIDPRRQKIWVWQIKQPLMIGITDVRKQRCINCMSA